MRADTQVPLVLAADRPAGGVQQRGIFATPAKVRFTRKPQNVFHQNQERPISPDDALDRLHNSHQADVERIARFWSRRWFNRDEDAAQEIESTIWLLLLVWLRKMTANEVAAVVAEPTGALRHVGKLAAKNVKRQQAKLYRQSKGEAREITLSAMSDPKRDGDDRFVPSCLADEGFDVENIDHKAQVREVWRAVRRQIPEGTRRLVLQRIFSDGLTQAQTAEALGLSRERVRQLYSDCLSRLRANLPYVSDEW